MDPSTVSQLSANQYGPRLKSSLQGARHLGLEAFPTPKHVATEQQDEIASPRGSVFQCGVNPLHDEGDAERSARSAIPGPSKGASARGEGAGATAGEGSPRGRQFARVSEVPVPQAYSRTGNRIPWHNSGTVRSDMARYPAMPSDTNALKILDFRFESRRGVALRRQRSYVRIVSGAPFSASRESFALAGI